MNIRRLEYSRITDRSNNNLLLGTPNSDNRWLHPDRDPLESYCNSKDLRVVDGTNAL